MMGEWLKIGAWEKRDTSRNHRLRRADWRFLLSSPHPTCSVAFADGLLAEAVTAISDTMCEAGQCPVNQCDLAVAVDPDRATLAAAWAALRPGGSFYVEWYSPRSGGVAGVRQRMQAAGFDAVSAYWPWPWPDRSPPAFWLPLEAPGALRYFLDERRPVQASALRLQSAILRGLWRLSRRVDLTLPVCVTARKPGNAAGKDAAPQTILDWIKVGWQGWDLGPTPDELSWLLLTGGYSAINKVVGLVFAEPDPQPRIAVKMARVPESIPSLANEACVLQALHGSRPGGVAGVPRLLFYEKGADQSVLGETVLTGSPLYAHLSQASFRKLALRATDWLVDLAGKPPPAASRHWWRDWAAPVLDEFAELFGAAVDPALIQRTRLMLAGVGDLPMVCEQRDFSPWNVLISPTGDWVVLDWESAELQGVPALDLIYFLTYLSFFVDGAMQSGQHVESYRAMLDPHTWTGAVFAECGSIYARRLGLDPAQLTPLRLLVWMLHACADYRQRLRKGHAPNVDQMRRTLFVRLWQEDAMRGDFDGS